MDRFDWWDGKDLADNGFLDMLIRQGAHNVRIEYHLKDKLLKIVDNRSGEVCGTYDETQTCPPTCPPGEPK